MDPISREQADTMIDEIRRNGTLLAVRDTMIAAIEARVERPQVNAAAIRELPSKRVKVEKNIRLNNTMSVASIVVPLLELPQDRPVSALVQAAYIDPDAIFPADVQVGAVFKAFIAEYERDSPHMIALIRENRPFPRVNSVYDRAALRGIDNEMMFATQKCAVRILTNEFMGCKKYLATAPTSTDPVWKQAAQSLVSLGADWMVQEKDVRDIKPDLFYTEGEHIGKRKVPAKRPRAF